MVALLTLVLTQDSIMILFVLKAILSTLKKYILLICSKKQLFYNFVSLS